MHACLFVCLSLFVCVCMYVCLLFVLMYTHILYMYIYNAMCVCRGVCVCGDCVFVYVNRFLVLLHKLCLRLVVQRGAFCFACVFKGAATV